METFIAILAIVFGILGIIGSLAPASPACSSPTAWATNASPEEVEAAMQH